MSPMPAGPLTARLRDDRPSLARVDSKLSELAHLVEREPVPAPALPSLPPSATASRRGSRAEPLSPRARLPLSDSFAYTPRFEPRERRPSASLPALAGEQASAPPDPPPPPPEPPHSETPRLPPAGRRRSSVDPSDLSAAKTGTPEDKEKAFLAEYAQIRAKLRESNQWKFSGHAALQPGEQVFDRCARSQFKFYRFDAARGTGRIVLRLTAIKGNPDLYASYQHDMPNLTQHEFKSAAEGDDEIILEEGDSRLRDAPLFISVHGQTECEYRLTAACSPVFELVPFKEVPASASRGCPAYFRLQATDPLQTAVVRVGQREEAHDSHRLRVFVSTRHRYPSAREHEWAVEDAGRAGGAHIDPGDPQFRPGVFYAAVECDAAWPDAAPFFVTGCQRKFPYDARAERAMRRERDTLVKRGLFDRLAGLSASGDSSASEAGTTSRRAPRRPRRARGRPLRAPAGPSEAPAAGPRGLSSLRTSASFRRGPPTEAGGGSEAAPSSSASALLLRRGGSFRKGSVSASLEAVAVGAPPASEAEEGPTQRQRGLPRGASFGARRLSALGPRGGAGDEREQSLARWISMAPQPLLETSGGGELTGAALDGVDRKLTDLEYLVARPSTSAATPPQRAPLDRQFSLSRAPAHATAAGEPAAPGGDSAHASFSAARRGSLAGPAGPLPPRLGSVSRRMSGSIADSFAYSARFEPRGRRTTPARRFAARLLAAVPGPGRSIDRVSAASTEEREKAFVRDFSAIRDRMRQSKVWKFEGHAALESGEPVVGHLEESELKFYRFEAPSRAMSRIVIRLVALSGNPDLYASYQHEMPNLTHYDFASAAVGDDEITIVEGDPRIRDAPLFISVHGQTRCEFRLTIHFATQVHLHPFKASQGRCLGGFPAYFAYLANDARLSVCIRVDQRAEDITELDMRLRLFVSTRHKYPSPGECEWVVEDAGSAHGITIDPPDPKFRTGWYYMAVEGAGAARGPAGASFVISAYQRKWPPEQQGTSRAQKIERHLAIQRGLYDRLMEAPSSGPAPLPSSSSRPGTAADPVLGPVLPPGGRSRAQSLALALPALPNPHDPAAHTERPGLVPLLRGASAAAAGASSRRHSLAIASSSSPASLVATARPHALAPVPGLTPRSASFSRAGPLGLGAPAQAASPHPPTSPRPLSPHPPSGPHSVSPQPPPTAPPPASLSGGRRRSLAGAQAGGVGRRPWPRP
eukprot:tig00020806_g14052.t1